MNRSLLIIGKSTGVIFSESKAGHARWGLIRLRGAVSSWIGEREKARGQEVKVCSRNGGNRERHHSLHRDQNRYPEARGIDAGGMERANDYSSNSGKIKKFPSVVKKGWRFDGGKARIQARSAGKGSAAIVWYTTTEGGRQRGPSDSGGRTSQKGLEKLKG